MFSEILLWCVLGPLCISGAAFMLAIRSCPSDGRFEWSQSVATALVVGGWVVAVAVALWGRQGFRWLPDEAWHSVVLPMAVVSLLLGFCQTTEGQLRTMQWLMAGLGMSWLALVVMPTGDAWQDVLPLHREWMFLVIVSGLSNIYWMQRLAESSAERWVSLVCLAGLAGPAILAGTVYAGIAEWFLSACVATGVAALLSLRWPAARLWTVVYPVCLFAAAGTASCRFYNYAEVPRWLYLLILFLPSIVAMVDLPFSQRISGRGKSAIRATVAVVVCGCGLAIVAGMLLQPQE